MKPQVYSPETYWTQAAYGIIRHIGRIEQRPIMIYLVSFTTIVSTGSEKITDLIQPFLDRMGSDVRIIDDRM